MPTTNAPTLLAAPTDDRPDTLGRNGWRARKWSALVMRIGALLVPAVGSLAAVWFVAHRYPKPTGWFQVGWWLTMFVLAVATYWLLERVARRLLPLAALLRLSLVFPDRTPSRFRIALIAGTTANLRRVVEEARHGVVGETPAEAAERLLILVAALNTHDRLTRGHSERVRAYAEVIGEEMGLDRGTLERLRWAALLHDVGKIEVPREILNKTGRLTDDEFEIIKTHPAAGAELVAPLQDWLGDEVLAVVQHHERFDGAGYPYGLSGEDISLAGRIVAVADTFDVITSARSYKKAVSPTEARAEIQRCSGSQFDPDVTRALLEVSLGRLWLAGGSMAWVASVPVLAGIPGIGAASPGLVGAAGAGLAATAVITGAGLTGVGASPVGGDLEAVRGGEATEEVAEAPGLADAGAASVQVRSTTEPDATVPQGSTLPGSVGGDQVDRDQQGTSDPGEPDGSTDPRGGDGGGSGSTGGGDAADRNDPSVPVRTLPGTPPLDPVIGDDGLLGGGGPVLGDDGLLGGGGPVLGDDGLLGGGGPVLGDDGLLGGGGPVLGDDGLPGGGGSLGSGGLLG